MRRVLLVALVGCGGCFYSETLADGGLPDCVFSCAEAGLTCGQVVACHQTLTCGPPCGVDGGSFDAGAVDAGHVGAADAGATVDAGTPVDAGMFVDAGVFDAGVAAVDGGAPDGGTVALDAGGSGFDSGAPSDAGPTVDAGTDAGPGGFGVHVVISGSDLKYLTLSRGAPDSCARIQLQSQFGSTPVGLNVVGGSWAGGGGAGYSDQACSALAPAVASADPTGSIAVNGADPTMVGLTSLQVDFTLLDGGQVRVTYPDGEYPVEH